MESADTFSETAGEESVTGTGAAPSVAGANYCAMAGTTGGDWVVPATAALSSPADVQAGTGKATCEKEVTGVGDALASPRAINSLHSALCQQRQKDIGQQGIWPGQTPCRAPSPPLPSLLDPGTFRKPPQNSPLQPQLTRHNQQQEE